MYRKLFVKRRFGDNPTKHISQRITAFAYFALLKEPSGGLCLISVYSAIRPARPLEWISSMSCSMVTAWMPRSPCKLSSSLNPELAEDGGCIGDGASSVAIQISPFVISISPILEIPFLTLFLSIIGLVELLTVVPLGFWIVWFFDVGERGVPTLGVTYTYKKSMNHCWRILLASTRTNGRN